MKLLNKFTRCLESCNGDLLKFTVCMHGAKTVICGMVITYSIMLLFLLALNSAG